MFAAERNKLNMFSAMNRGSLILINTAKGFLKQEACEIFGRFFIALIGQATLEREQIKQDKRLDTFVYIDEAHEYFDESLGSLFEEARKFGVGVVIAHQNLDQFDHKLLGTVKANTAVKLAGGVSGDDAAELAKGMKCDRQFIQGMRKYDDSTEFACFVKDYTTKSALPLKVPFFKMEDEPKMTAARLASLIERNRARYGASNENPPDKPKDDDSPLGDPELL
jgi:hypothetical protein